MTVLDYLNSPNGKTTVLVYGGLVTIVNVNIGFVIAWVHVPAKFPDGYSAVIMAIVGAVCSTAAVAAFAPTPAPVATPATPAPIS